jgi:hypothetical protein
MTNEMDGKPLLPLYFESHVRYGLTGVNTLHTLVSGSFSLWVYLHNWLVDDKFAWQAVEA